MNLNDIVVVIPSLNPDDRICDLIMALVKAGFKIIVVDDGSTSDTKKYFEKIRQNNSATLLSHEINKGKGRALKTAFEYITENMKGITGVITADADGQHRVEDIVRCAEKLISNSDNLIMGCRVFNDKTIPFRSRFGNKLTSKMINWLCGISLSDTQTGLRGIPYCYLDTFKQVKGERFEYEMNMLLETKTQGIKLLEIPIKTIYIDENRTSHFNPFRDSLKIYSIFLKFIASSLSSSVVDIALFTILVFWLKGVFPQSYILVSTVIARFVSSIVNYIINHKTVFKADKNNVKTVIRYYLLCIVQMLVSALLVYGSVNFIKLNETISKIIVDTILFLISFYIQREWVFKRDIKNE